jgi:predicted alpha/beta hydrolase family esterase
VNWERVRTNCSDFFVYNSNNDPYVPLQYGREIADNLHTNLTVIHEGGHINASAGYVQFEPLLVDLVKLLGE